MACLGVGDFKQGSYSYYLVEKQNTVDYQIFHTLLTKSVENSCTHEVKLSKEELTDLLRLAESESEKEMLRYGAVKVAGLSNTKATEVYGIGDFQNRKERLEDALPHAKAIRESVEKIARLKDKGLLASLGFEFDTESDPSDTQSESDPDDQMSENEEPSANNNSLLSDSAKQSNTEPDGQYQSNHYSSMHKPQEFQLDGNSDQCFKHQSETSEI